MPAADTDGVATAEVPVGVHAVTAALPVTALEVAAFIEDNLARREKHASLKLMLQYSCVDSRGHCSPLNKLFHQSFNCSHLSHIPYTCISFSVLG